VSEFALYREPIVLDSILHRDLKIKRFVDPTVASGLRACYLAAGEFTQAAREFVIVFLRTAVEGRPQVQPIVLLGVIPGENLFVHTTNGPPWDARYVPAYIRRYPFWTTRLEGQPDPAVMVDLWWQGLSPTEGEPLYEADGRPAPRLLEAIDFLLQFDDEVARTEAFCNRLDELGLLDDMSADLTLPDGSKLVLNGFLTVDEARLKALPDAQVVELHRSGALGLLNAHLSSLDNLHALLERKARRMGGAAR